MKFLSAIFGLLLSINLMAHDGHDTNLPSAHLTFKDGNLHAHVNFLSAPTVGKDSPMKIVFKRASDHASVNITDKVKVVLWMPDMNHGSSPTRTALIRNEIGAYNTDRVFFSMGGLWDIRIQLTDGQGNVETQSFEVYLQSNGGGHHH